jgi:hypothetical protein
MPETMDDETVICSECGNREHLDAAWTSDAGNTLCETCVQLCYDCDAVLNDRDTITAAGGYGLHDRTYCTNCASRCRSCGRAERNDDMVLARWSPGSRRRRRYCEDCASYCDGCDQYWEGGWVHYDDYSDMQYCENCRESRPSYTNDGTIRGYGHTHVQRWLGGPGGRFYLGFENEIGTERLTAVPIQRWAEDNLRFGDVFDCKEDSSVQGFEIASQPMTPEYFEDVDWDSFFNMLNTEYPCPTGTEEYDGHGLHVHIGRVAFRHPETNRVDDISIAAFAYLLSQSDHLERIGRRPPTEYCAKVHKPVSVAVIANTEKQDKQAKRLRAMGHYPGRDAINLTNENTIEIRAFKSARTAEDLRAAVRVVYVAAEYVTSLRDTKQPVSGKALHWSEFAKWTKHNHPAAHASIAGPDKK